MYEAGTRMETLAFQFQPLLLLLNPVVKKLCLPTTSGHF